MVRIISGYGLTERCNTAFLCHYTDGRLLPVKQPFLILLRCSAENNLQPAAISSLSETKYYLLFILEKPVVAL
ncbi:hypothetical protein UA45_02930 [Morganella morganii]|uniref:Uncharacterized protein n=1 Tax=Morganella morganii TaxID=582 RepID=A0A0D8LAU3_MORMO|nr:hypothetical protein UA45_02930 [Morganella morganii]